MELQIQDLVSSIKKDGIDSANKEAAAIVAQAKEQANSIIAQAKAEAEKLRQDANAEIDVFKNSARLSAEQAKRDAVLAFRQEIQKEFEKILAADVCKALDQQTLATLIRAALQGEDVSAYTVEVGQVTDAIRQELAQELKNGLEIRPSKKVGAGFRLAAKDGSGYFDCSDQEIAEMLMPFFRDMHLSGGGLWLPTTISSPACPCSGPRESLPWTTPRFWPCAARRSAPGYTGRWRS